MNKSMWNLFCSVVVTLLLIGCTAKKAVVSELDFSEVKTNLTTLASDEFEGRETGKEGAKKAAAYIVDKFKSYGLQPLGDNGSYYQEFSKILQVNPHATAEDGPVVRDNNVVGFIDNGAKKTIVLGAHYDHLGYGGLGSLYDGEPKIHNGADDNASGISLLLELAKQLAKAPKEKHNFLILAFSGEEQGLLGSNFYSKHPTLPQEQMLCMLNMDMVGRLKAESKLAVQGAGTAAEWDDILANVDNAGVGMVKEEGGIGPTDYTSFYLIDVPVLGFFTGQHENYHKPSDDVQYINFDGMKKIYRLVTNIIDELGKYDELTFQKTKEPKQVNRDWKVTLGVMPDYLYDQKGMRIDGTREGRPADKAGILKGDVVLKMGELDINDMNSYMESLGKFSPGQEIDVLVLRDGKEMVLKVVFD